MIAAPASVATTSTGPASLATASTLGSMLLSLLVVIGIILICAWLLRRMTGMVQGGSELLRVRASLALGMKERLVLVEAGGETLLLGVSPAGIRRLHRFDAPLPELATGTTGGSFGALLAQRMRGTGAGK